MAGISRTIRTLVSSLAFIVFALLASFAPITAAAQDAATLPPVGGCFCNSTGTDPAVNVRECVENAEACNLKCCGDSQTSCAACECIETCTIGAPEEGATGAAGLKAKTYQLENPIKYDTIEEAVGGVIKIFVGVSGSIALLMFTYGGVMMLISGGNQERVDAGRKAITWASIGLAVIFLSYAVLRLIFTSLGAGL